MSGTGDRCQHWGPMLAQGTQAGSGLGAATVEHPSASTQASGSAELGDCAPSPRSPTTTPHRRLEGPVTRVVTLS